MIKPKYGTISVQRNLTTKTSRVRLPKPVRQLAPLKLKRKKEPAYRVECVDSSD